MDDVGKRDAAEDIVLDDTDELESLLRDELEDPAFRGAYEDAEARSKVLAELARVRRAMHSSQAHTAEIMGTTQSAISELEGGTSDPRLSTLQRYARAVGCALELGVAQPLTANELTYVFFESKLNAVLVTELARVGNSMAMNLAKGLFDVSVVEPEWLHVGARRVTEVGDDGVKRSDISALAS